MKIMRFLAPLALMNVALAGAEEQHLLSDPDLVQKEAATANETRGAKSTEAVGVDTSDPVQLRERVREQERAHEQLNSPDSASDDFAPSEDDYPRFMNQRFGIGYESRMGGGQAGGMAPPAGGHAGESAHGAQPGGRR